MYAKSVSEFREWLAEAHPTVSLEELTTDLEDLDEALVEFFDIQYLDWGRTSGAGCKLLAALAFSFPTALRAVVRQRRLPHVSLALQGWKRLHPGGIRHPWPFAAVCAMAMELYRQGHWDMAVLTMITMDLYLRPGEAVGLETQDIVTPVKSLEQQYRHAGVNLHSSLRARPSKTHQFDESLLLGSPTRPFLTDLLMRLSLEARCRLGTDRLRGWTRSRDGRLVTFGLREWRAAWNECLARLCLPQAHLYVLRHTGASEDLLTKQRTLNEVQKRGRWLAETSLRRYAKPAAVQQQVNSWPPALVAHLAQCRAEIGRVLLQRAPALEPPSLQKLRRWRSA
jgi:hypothetical protein